MKWIEVTVSTSAAGIDPVCDRLNALDFTDLAIEDESDFRSYLDNNRKRWDYVDDDLYRYMAGLSRVKFYVRNNEAGRESIKRAEQGLQALASLFPAGQLGSLELSTVVMDEDEWADCWKKYFKPLPVGSSMVICPEWEDIADYPQYDGRLVLRINPGMLFGSGSHQTTMLCLRALERCVRPGGAFLDLGCGSGILSVGALLYGASDAFCVDLDPTAKTIVSANASLNGIHPEKLHILIGDIIDDTPLRRDLSQRTYPAIAANIVADVLISIAPLIPRLLSAGGRYIASGIIDLRLKDVLAEFHKSGLQVLEINGDGGWYCIVCQAEVSA